MTYCFCFENDDFYDWVEQQKTDDGDIVWVAKEGAPHRIIDEVDKFQKAMESGFY